MAGMGGMLGFGGFKPAKGSKKQHGNTVSGKNGMLGMKVIKPKKQSVTVKKASSK